MATSTVSSNLAKAAFLTSGIASASVYPGLSTSLADWLYFFPTLNSPKQNRRSKLLAFSSFPQPSVLLRVLGSTLCSGPSPLRHNLQPHAAGRSLHGRDRCRQVPGIEVWQLRFGNLLHLLLGDLSHLVLVWLPRSLSDSGGTLQKHGGWRCLGNERETPVVIHRDN